MSGTVRTAAVALLLIGGLASVGVTAAAGAPGETTAQPQTDEPEPISVPDHNTSGPFNLSVERVEPCGLTCRNITVQLTNDGNQTAENVTVESEILVEDESIVQRRAQVGTLQPNETVNRSVSVSVGFSELSAIRENSGRITLQTQVTSDQFNETFIGNRTVL